MPKADLAYCDCEVLARPRLLLPLGDRSWPDDTPGSTGISSTMRKTCRAREEARKADLIAALGQGTVVHFDSGYEV